MSAYNTLMEAINGKEFLILDTETTGLRDGEIVQIAIIDQNGKTLMNEFVKPFKGIPADATRIHGITEEMVKDAPTWNLLMPKIDEIVRGKILVVYNAIYDRKMMHRSLEHAGDYPKVEWKEIAQWHCAMEAYAEFWGEWNDYHGSYRWQRLSNAARQQSVTVPNAHDALGDCLMTLGVVNAMLKKWNEGGES